jgi:mgtE-like transporter
VVTVNLLAISGQSRLILMGLGALLISSLAASFAGIYLGSERHIFELIPGLMVLLPPSINMRGSISGVMASRLSSSMHLGIFEVKFHRESVLGDNLRASFIVTILVAFILGIYVNIVSHLAGIEVISVIDIIVISVLSGVIAGLIVTAITLLVSLICYRYGLDLDMIAAPTVTTAGDIVTLPVLVIVAFLVIQLDPAIKTWLFAIAVIATLASLLYSWYTTNQVKSIIREIVPLLFLLSLFGTLAGLTYALDLDRLIAFAALLVLIPPFMGTMGSIGGILCSRLATGMHMGAIAPKVIPERDVAPHFVQTYLYSIVLLPLLAVIAHYAAGMLGAESPGLGNMVGISLVAGLIVLTMVTFFAYLTASMSFRYGLDPDNFGIPVITSIIDLMGAAVLIAVINILL